MVLALLTVPVPCPAELPLAGLMLAVLAATLKALDFLRASPERRYRAWSDENRRIDTAVSNAIARAREMANGTAGEPHAETQAENGEPVRR